MLFALFVVALVLIAAPAAGAFNTPTPSPLRTTAPPPTTKPTATPMPSATPPPGFSPTPVPVVTAVPSPFPTPTPTQPPTPTPTATLAATPVPSCLASMPNLVLNPSFETTTGPNVIYVYEANTTHAPPWTRTKPQTNPPEIMTSAVNNYGTQAPYQGTKYAMLQGTFGQGLIGKLSTPATAGTFVLSARVSKPENASTDVFLEMRLRNKSTGSETTQAVHAAVADETNWVLVSGAVTVPLSAVYDSVVLRFYQPGDWSYIDAAGVCEAPGGVGAGSGKGSGWVIVAAAVLLALVGYASVRIAGRRRRRTAEAADAPHRRGALWDAGNDPQ